MMRGSLAERLRVLRAQRGLSLTEAAERAGIQRQTLAFLERGERRPHTPTLAKIAAAYGVPVEELLELEEPALAGKAEAPPSPEQLRLYDVLEEEWREKGPHSRLARFRRWRARNESGLAFLRDAIQALAKGEMANPRREGGLITLAARAIFESGATRVTRTHYLDDELDEVLEAIEEGRDVDEDLRREALSIWQQLSEAAAIDKEVRLAVSAAELPPPIDISIKLKRRLEREALGNSGVHAS
jgi:transcriptional regulator with XRE-family HTH domain